METADGDSENSEQALSAHINLEGGHLTITWFKVVESGAFDSILGDSILGETRVFNGSKHYVVDEKCREITVIHTLIGIALDFQKHHRLSMLRC